MATLMIQNARCSFPSLFQTAQYKGEDLGKYEVTLLLEKDGEMAKMVEKAIKDVGTEVLGKAWTKAKLPMKDGDGVDYDGYQNQWALKATTKKRPLCIDRDKTPLTEEDGVIYPGCYINAKVSIYAYTNSYGSFVGAQLEAVQFSKHGESFGGGGASVDDFEDISDTDAGGDAPF
ncbi:MAG: ssDNA-binding protein [Halieaceae bacterium]|jgi:hypothetical protein